jgi:L-2,4-diaminobutyric acid acetyltransferase
MTGNTCPDIGLPGLGDGMEMHRLATESGVLDVNSPYAYLLCASHFRETCRIFRTGGKAEGFTTGYLKPDDPSTLFIWQVAVSANTRGRGVAAAMIVDIVEAQSHKGVRHVEATVTRDNSPSIRMFDRLASSYGLKFEITPCFPSNLFPGNHVAEDLVRIGPFPEPTDL